MTRDHLCLTLDLPEILGFLVNYANIFMGELEQKLIVKGKPHILIWKWFIDDIFVIWTGSETDFVTYMEKINQIHTTIKFTYEKSKTELTFLDVTLYKGERFLENQILNIRTYIKPINNCISTQPHTTPLPQ